MIGLAIWNVIVCLGTTVGSSASAQSVLGVVDCSGTYTFHFTSAYMASKGLVPGSRVCAQFYSPDNGFAFPNNIGLKAAIEFLACP